MRFVGTETDAQDAANARSYWTSGVALGGRGSKKMEEGKWIYTRLL